MLFNRYLTILAPSVIMLMDDLRGWINDQKSSPVRHEPPD